MGVIQDNIESVIFGDAPPTSPVPFNASSGVLAKSLIVKADNGYLFGFTVYNSKGSAQWVLLFDSATVPADTAVPLLAFPVAASSQVSALWLPPRFFESGITLCNSTTDTTKTLGAADCLFDVQYV